MDARRKHLLAMLAACTDPERRAWLELLLKAHDEKSAQREAA